MWWDPQDSNLDLAISIGVKYPIPTLRAKSCLQDLNLRHPSYGLGALAELS